MSWLSELFKSDPWREIERKVKRQRDEWQPQFERFVKSIKDDVLDIVVGIVLREQTRRKE